MKNLISDNKNLSLDLTNTRDIKNNLFVDQTLESVLTAFYQILKEYPMGIESSNIVNLISQATGIQFDYKAYGCHSVYEFINKFVIPTTEITIITNKPDSFTIRSK